MATLTLGASVDHWPPAMLEGGTITARSSTSMTYVSNLGYTVTLKGASLTYDDDGLPSFGTVTRVTVTKDGTDYADFNGVSLDFARAGMLLFGFDEQNGGHRGPDVWSFVNLLLKFDDLMIGSADNNSFTGTHGNDTIQAGDGDDEVGGEGGNDVMDGGDGWDLLWYTDANYSWESYRGVNLDAATGIVVDCWGDTDTISNFEQFVDSLYSDTLKGSDADEEFNVSRGGDVVNGRGGFDWINYEDSQRWGAQHGIIANLDMGYVIDPWKLNDLVTNIEGLRGTILNDWIKGSTQDEVFLAGRGLDTVDGAGGIDEIGFWIVGNNDDGGHGVTINLGKVKEVIDDGYGNAESADNIENVGGSRFDDGIVGNGVQNFLWGDDGNDTLNGGGGADDLGGGWGNDLLVGGLGKDSIGGNGDDDTVTGGAGVDQFYFGWDLVDVGVDRITDFAAGSETIWVGEWWGGNFATENLVASQFRSGAGVTTANSTSQRFIYNSTTGDLFFDADGSGTGSAAVRFATLSNLAVLTFNDIQIMF